MVASSRLSGLTGQAMKRKTRMPNLGITDDDAQAITMFLKTLRAPKPDQPVQKVSN